MNKFSISPLRAPTNRRGQEPDSDRSPVAAASCPSKVMDFRIPIAVGTCGGRGPSVVRFRESLHKLVGLIAAFILGCRVGGVAAEIDETKLPPPAQRAVDFDRDVRPLFEGSCFRCHGPERPRSRFSLVSQETALKGGENGVDILPGQSAKSPLIHYVAHLVEDMEMPPPGKGEPLTAQQIGLLRAWIDQGAKWSQQAVEVKTMFSISPVIRWIGVSGDERQFREQMWTQDGWVGGLQEFRLEEQLKPGEKFRAQGAVLGDAREYRLRLDYEKTDFGFARAGFEQYRRYYDDTGGFYAPFPTNAFGLDRDLAVDVGRAWIEFGLTMPHWPRLVLGYEYQFKEGTKSSLGWSDFGPQTPDSVTRAIFPAYKDVDEKVHILKFDLSHEIAGVTIEDNFRAEFYDSQTRRVSTTSFDVGEAKEEQDHWEAVNTLHAEKQLRDWLFLSGGYLYSRLSADATFNLESIQPSVPALVLDASNPITLKRESHVFNANARLGPWKDLTFTAGLQNEWTHEEGFGSGLQVPNPHISSSQRDKALLEEDLGLRFTAIPFTVLYADARLQQEWVDHFENDAFNAEGSAFLRDTDARSDLYQYRTGFTISPWQPVLFEANYKHRLKRSQYNHLTDFYPPFDPVTGEYFPGDYAGNGYPAFIREREVDQDEFEAKLALRPAKWLKTTLKYQWRGTDYRTTTDPSTVTLFDPVTFDTIISPQPGGSILAGNYDAHIYSLNAALTPWRRLYLATTFSYTQSRIVSGVNERGGLVPYDGDIYSVL
ncbi:MAG: hypothetical protein L0Z50_15345, partial [Verrucomicrobiales bacterium]|nr:hypothetical protein [Verrucomicrobiales bacterium]